MHKKLKFKDQSAKKIKGSKSDDKYSLQTNKANNHTKKFILKSFK